MNNMHTFLILAVLSIITIFLRELPYLVFGRGKTIPKWLEYLGKVLPFACMGMLLVYCLKDLSFASVSGFVPEALACGVILLLYLWKKNSLLCIIGGTVFYVALVNLVKW